MKTTIGFLRNIVEGDTRERAGEENFSGSELYKKKSRTNRGAKKLNEVVIVPNFPFQRQVSFADVIVSPHVTLKVIIFDFVDQTKFDFYFKNTLCITRFIIRFGMMQ